MKPKDKRDYIMMFFYSPKYLNSELTFTKNQEKFNYHVPLTTNKRTVLSNINKYLGPADMRQYLLKDDLGR